MILAGIAISNLLEIKKNPHRQLSPRAIICGADCALAEQAWHRLALNENVLEIPF